MYVIESVSTGRRYVGQTGDLNRRLAEHNTAGHNSMKYTTKQSGPWRLVYHEQYSSRSEAIKREHWLKLRTGRRWLNGKLSDRVSPAEMPGLTAKL